MTSVAPNADAAATRPIGISGGTSTLLAWLAFVGCAAFVVFFGGALPFIHIPAARIAVQLIALVTAVASIALIWTGRIDPRTPFRLPVIACVAVMVASTLVSEQPSVSRESLALLLLAAPLYPVLRAMTWSTAFRVRIENLTAIAAIAVVVGYGIQVGLIWIRWWAEVGLSIPPLRPADAALTTGTVNSLATYLELLVLPAIWVLWVRVGRTAALALAVGAFVAIVVTGSRGAWIGLTVAGAVVAAMHMPAIATAVRSRAAGRPWMIPAIGGGVLIAVVGGVVVALPRLAAGDAGRIELWQAAIAIGLEHPVLGAGPGTWQDLRTFHQITDPRTAALFTPHNGILQVFAETGLLGMLAVGWLVVTFARVGLSAVRAAPSASDGALRELTLASLIAVGVHALVDPQFGVPGVALLVLLALARLDPAPGTAPSAGLGRQRSLELAVATAVAVVLLVPTDIAMTRAASGNSALDRADWANASADFDAALALDDRPLYRLGRAIAASGTGDTAAALAALDAAARTDDLTFMTAANALLTAHAGSATTALALAEEVVERPYDPTATVNAALVQYDAGKHDAATATLADTMASVWSLTYSERPAELFDGATWDAARAEALARIQAGDPALYAYALIRGGAPRADVETAIAALPAGTERDVLGLLQASEYSRETTLDAARALALQKPDSALALLALDRIARNAGSQRDLDLARWLSTATFFEPTPLDQELVVDGAPSANYSMRLYNYPYAMLRPGPKRPYPVGMVTIEPVLANP